jgi:hypothetical protein
MSLLKVRLPISVLIPHATRTSTNGQHGQSMGSSHVTYDPLTARLSRRVADGLSRSAASEDSSTCGGGDAVPSTAVAITFSCQVGAVAEEPARFTYGLTASVTASAVHRNFGAITARVTTARTQGAR